MYAITGITGKVGGALARSLLAERLPVRAVLRDEAKAAEWRTRGCDVALAEMDDAASLTSAFRAAAGVFILPPSEFDPEPGFPEAKRVIAAVTAALAEARPGKVVCLSTIGADAPHENLLTQRTLMEQSLEEIGLPVTFLRPGWFMENALWDVPSARDEGVLRSFLQPADKLFPMVATQDVGRLAAALLREDWIGIESSSWRGPPASRPTISPAPSPRCWSARSGSRRCRARAGKQIFRFQGTQESVASDPVLGRLQRGLDRVQRPRPVGGQRYDDDRQRHRRPRRREPGGHRRLTRSGPMGRYRGKASSWRPSSHGRCVPRLGFGTFRMPGSDARKPRAPKARGPISTRSASGSTMRIAR